MASPSAFRAQYLAAKRENERRSKPKAKPKARKAPEPGLKDYATSGLSALYAAANPKQTGMALGLQLGQALPSIYGDVSDYLTSNSPSDVLGDVVGGAKAMGRSMAANPLSTIADFVPGIGEVKGLREDIQRAAELRAAGNPAAALTVERMALPFAVASLLPGVGEARGAGKMAVRAAEDVLPDLAVRDIGLGQKMYTTPEGSRITVMEDAKFAPRKNSITDFVVPEELRGQGRGGALLDAALQKYDPTEVSAAASSPSSAALLYKRGFRPAGEPNADLARALEIMKEDSSVTMVVPREPQSRITWPDEGQWELPDLTENVEITTTGPAIIHRPKPVETWHGTPSVFAAERKVLTPGGTEQFIAGQPDILPDVPTDFKVLKDYPLGRFRSEYLNSGEGAQQYGIGTYLAENPAVGRDYRSELTQDAFEPEVGGVPLAQLYEKLQRTADRSGSQSLYDQLATLEDLGLHGDVRGVLDRAAEGAYPQEAVDWFQREIVPGYRAPGALYRVGMNIDPRAMLDWDAPLQGQSEAVRRAVQNLDLSGMGEGHRTRVMLERFLAGQEQPEYRATGQTLLTALPHGSTFEHTPEGSQYLLSQGIPGIRYWDEGSRETKRGTRNFVVFDPERDLEIKDRFAVGGRVNKLAVKH